MRLLKTLLPLLALLLWSGAAKADYNPADPPEPGVNFMLTTQCVPAEGGYNLTQSGMHAFGSSVYLNVYPNTGFKFSGWEDEDGNVVSADRSFSYTMPSRNITLTARFEYNPDDPVEPSTPVFKDESQIDFAINPPDAGYFSYNYSGIYEVGTNHTFTANAYSNHRFLNWTKNGEVIGTERTLNYIVPKGDHTLVANFEYDPGNPEEPGEQHFYRNLKLVSNPEEAAALNINYYDGNSGSYLDGATLNIHTNVNTWYHFINWTDDLGNVVSDQQDFSYTMPNRNVTLTANFNYDYDPSDPGEPGIPNPDGSIGENMVLWPRFGMYDDTHVQILCETPGSTIHYTLDGTDPTTASPIYTDPVYVSSNLLVKAFAVKEGMDNSPIRSYQVTAYKTAAPVFTFENLKLNITSDTPDAIIRYTTDFSEPTAESDVFTEPFLPEENCRIKAYASKEGLTDSPVSIYVYRRAEHTIPAPELSLNDDGKLVITPAVSGGTTYYTIDGSDPDTGSMKYGTPITLTHNCTVKAYTTHTNYFDSPIGSYSVTSFALPTPSITFSGKMIRMSCDDADATIRYTTDGSNPTKESTVYTTPFLPEADCEVKAYAAKEGFNDSEVASYVFNRAEHTAGAPTFAFDGKDILVINAAVDGGETRYTTDGSNPDASSALYTGPITLTQNCTVKAYTTHPEYLDSQVASYLVNTFGFSAPLITFENKMITITSFGEGSIVRYTLDGSDPTPTSQIYTEPFLPDFDCEIRAYATKDGFNDSEVSNYFYVRDEHTLPAPVFALNADKNLTITQSIDGSETRFTADGSTPTTGSGLYAGPFTPASEGTVKAFSTHTQYFDSPVAEYVISDHREAAPEISKDYRNREITVTQPEGLRILLTINGETTETETPVSINVDRSMTSISATAIAEEADRLNSVVNAEPIIFHEAPELSYDGHEVHVKLSDTEPMPDRAEGYHYFNGNLRQYGSADEVSIEVYEFGTFTSHMESDAAFRSDDIEMNIDFFNTGRIAGAMNGHRLSEAFGTWGDNSEDYTYLRVKGGEITEEDLRFISTLPNLATLHLAPNFFTVESCDSIFAGTRIETMFSTSYPEGMLKGMPRLTTVMWGIASTEKMPDGRIAEAGNPNILFWTTDASLAPTDAKNVVVYDYIGEGFPTDPEGTGITGMAEEISLESGYPFNAHMPVMANSVTMTKEFTQPTEIGISRGWETIAIPFTPLTIEHANGTEIVPFAKWSGDDDAPKPFWLYSASTSDWQPADSIKAGVPYIISMPNNEEYLPEYNLNGLIKFKAKDVVLGTETSMPLAEEWIDSMWINATFMPVEKEYGMLSLNTRGEGDLLPGSVFIAEALARPMEAFVTGAGSRQSVPVFGGSGIELPKLSATGVTAVSPSPGTIRISSLRTCKVVVTDIAGATVAQADVPAGESVSVSGLTKGIYIVAGLKLMVK